MKEGARSVDPLVRLGQTCLGPHTEHQTRTLAVPVESPVPRLDSCVGNAQLQPSARRVADLVAFGGGLERLHASICQPNNGFGWSHSGPFSLQPLHILMQRIAI